MRSRKVNKKSRRFNKKNSKLRGGSGRPRSELSYREKLNLVLQQPLKPKPRLNWLYKNGAQRSNEIRKERERKVLKSLAEGNATATAKAPAKGKATKGKGPATGKDKKDKATAKSKSTSNTKHPPFFNNVDHWNGKTTVREKKPPSSYNPEPYWEGKTHVGQKQKQKQNL